MADPGAGEASPAAAPGDGARGPRTRTGGAAALVAAGILGSRLLGLVRQSLIARYLGAGVASDSWLAAFKIPNVLQNLFGEGALSAAFIPVYSRLLGQGRDEEADRTAGAVGAILALAVAVLVLVGVLAAPLLIYLIAPGFTGARRDLTVTLTRILFPGAGLLVMSAWCLGVLNSHRKFLVSYAAPMAWNVVLIAALAWWGPLPDKARVVALVAWASVGGSLLQFVVQLPSVRSVAPRLRFAVRAGSEHVREVLRNFGPVFLSRGVVQVSSYIDQFLTSLLPNGMVTVFGFATTLYVLPVSLFGASISVAELPEMSRSAGGAGVAGEPLRARLEAGLRRIAFLVVPSAVAFIAIGDVLARLVFQYGRFTALDVVYTWAVLAGAAVGLQAGTLSRLYSSTYYALGDTRTPLRFAVIRVTLTAVLGVLLGLLAPRLLGIDVRWGVAGLSASAGMAAWVEFALLRSRLGRRIGATRLGGPFVIRLWALAVVGAEIAVAVQRAVAGWTPILAGILVVGVYGVVYVGGALALRIPEAHGVVGGLARRLGGRR
ncbi:MAG TPA: murein biosynthesis integral membrane protein MurJ [Gemmatimonadaceae bacterium]|nr:murein biosynthesis integral membrane protein MurJ [Gemmatimonadaceae bacterium]